MRAAVLHQLNDKVDVRDDVEIRDPGPGEVKLAIKATGVCHSDLSGVNGTIPVTLPCILGHEGAGEVVAVGPGVTGVVEGNHAIVAWVPPCGACSYCLGGQPQLCPTMMMAAFTRSGFTVGGKPAFGFAGAGTFAEELVLPQEGVVVIPDDVPYEVASLIGCAVTTGVGAAINTAQVRPGSSVVVFGCGGVGISIIQGARLAGAAEIVAVDLVDNKLDDARRFGATHGVTPDQLADTQAEVTAGQGFDYAFEAIGNPATIRAAWDATRRGGTTVVVGVGRLDQQVTFSPFELFYSEKNLKGCVYGSSDVRTDFHRLLRLWRAGRLDLEEMITRRIDMAEVNDAFGAMERGEVIRQVITL